MKATQSSMNLQSSLWTLLLLAIWNCPGSAQTNGPVVQIRPTFGMLYLTSPELSGLPASQGGRYEGPGWSPSGSLSVLYHVADRVALAVGVHYVRFRVRYAPFPQNTPASARWEITGITPVISCEYSVPLRVGSVDPFIGIGLGYSFGSVEEQSDIVVSGTGEVPFRHTGKQEPLALAAKLGFVFPVLDEVEGVAAFEFWRTGNIRPMAVEQGHDVGMYVTGIGITLSAQF